MNDLFGGVVYAGIDTDRYKYPIGSGRVTFGNQKSFMKAVKAGFVEIKTGKFTKKVTFLLYLSMDVRVPECSCLATRCCLSVFIAPERESMLSVISLPGVGSD